MMQFDDRYQSIIVDNQWNTINGFLLYLRNAYIYVT